MKLHAVWIAFATFAVAFAGCADADAEGGTNGVQGKVDSSEFQLGAGKGAIAGLLVDDRFRPIHLTDSPSTEFQAQGFILLQELGLKVQTNENGEFTFVDLPPGRYTLRVTADGHEAAPQEVRVDEGVFNEINVIARRVTSLGGLIITQEFSVFIDCWIPFWTELNCFADWSFDSKRAGFVADYRGVNNLTYLKSEWLFNEVGGYDGDVGHCEGEFFTGWHSVSVDHGDYLSMILTSRESEWENRGEDTFLNGYMRDKEPCTVVWPHGQLRDMVGVNFGFGISTQAQIIQSAFIGAPEVDIEAYCVLC